MDSKDCNNFNQFNAAERDLLSPILNIFYFEKRL